MKTSIGINKETRSRLRRHGIVGETYDSVINRLMDKQEKKEAYIDQHDSVIYHLRQEVARLKEEAMVQNGD